MFHTNLTTSNWKCLGQRTLLTNFLKGKLITSHFTHNFLIYRRLSAEKLWLSTGFSVLYKRVKLPV